MSTVTFKPSLHPPPSPFWLGLAAEHGYVNGVLICQVCRKQVALMQVEDAARWLRSGWPKCCGEVAVWDRTRMV